MSQINTQEMIRLLDSISRERNVDRAILIRDLELAMVSAARSTSTRWTRKSFVRA